MKFKLSYLILAAVALISFRVFAETGPMTALSPETVDALNAAAHCSTEMAELAQLGNVSGIEKSVGTQDVDTYQIQFSGNAYVPTGTPYPMGSLTITRSMQIQGHGSAMVYGCAKELYR